LGRDIDRNKFTKERLPALLASAKKFLCDLTQYEPDSKFDVIRVYGDASPQTVCKVSVIQPSDPNTAPDIKTAYCDNSYREGDGPFQADVTALARLRFPQLDRSYSASFHESAERPFQPPIDFTGAGRQQIIMPP
jgi:hypothetical protein